MRLAKRRDGLGRDALPGAQATQQFNGKMRQRDLAAIEIWRFQGCGGHALDQGDGQPLCCERAGKAQPSRAGTDDNDIEICCAAQHFTLYPCLGRCLYLLARAGLSSLPRTWLSYSAQAA